MKQKLRVMLDEDYDEEMNAMCVCVQLLKRLSFDAQWRVLHYILARVMGRSWTLNKPQNG